MSRQAWNEGSIPCIIDNGFGVPGDEGGPGIEVAGIDIPHGTVGIVDHDFRGAGGKGPLDRGVDVRGHPLPGSTVFRRAG